MSRLRIVLVGLGARGQYWAEVINRSAECELCAYIDPNPVALETAQQRFGAKPSFVTLAEALSALPDTDAVILATPPEGRERQIRAACERGLPLLIEKPLALSLEEATRFVQIAETANVPMMIGLNFRYLAVTKATLELFKHGKVGTPAFGHFTYERWRDGTLARLNKYPLTMTHPMLWEQSVHHFDLLRFVYQSEPLSVYCKTWNPSWSMYQDDTNVSAVFTFVNGIIVNYQGTWQSGWREPNFVWRTDCTRGVVFQKDQFGELHYAKRYDAALTGVALPPHETWITDTEGVLAAFVNTLLHNQPLEASGHDHLKSLAIVEACVRSSQEARAVDIPPLLTSLSQQVSLPLVSQATS
jgi:predicted dehydrogenase